MPFSRSTFIVEINGVPTFVLQATRQSEAEEICSDWSAENLQHLIELNIIDPRASTKVRIARSNERCMRPKLRMLTDTKRCRWFI